MMVETAFPTDQNLPRTIAQPAPVEISPAVVDAVITVAGSVLFAVAGVMLGFYLMLPFNLG